MYYKVIKDNKVIDVLNDLHYLKYQPKYKHMVFCDESEAQAVLSSDQKNKWHVQGMYKIPVEGYDTVVLEKIDKYEYERLKMLNGRTPEEIIDQYTIFLMESGVL